MAQTQSARRAENEVVPAGGRELDVVDFGDDAGAGLESVRPEEMLTPFIGLLQALSPQLDKTHASYIKGAEAGMFVNTLTGQLFDGEKGLECVFFSKDYVYGEWIPRESGGGFRGTKSPDDPMVQKLLREQGGFKALRTPDGNDLVEQFNLYGLFAAEKVESGFYDPAVLACTSTKIKVYKGLMTRILNLRYGKPKPAPIYAHRWRLTAIAQSNTKGRFFNYHFDLAGGENPRDSLITPDNPVYQEAKQFSQMFSAGRVQANYEAAAAAGGAAGSDEEIPF